jgi:hypothetical protein
MELYVMVEWTDTQYFDDYSGECYWAANDTTLFVPKKLYDKVMKKK